MSNNSYNNIKRYAAFIFMVFTVLSGSSEGFDSASYVKISKKAFFDILASNKLLIQEAGAQTDQSDTESQYREKNGFRELPGAITEAAALKHVQSNMLPLFASVYIINDTALKNNIWKSTVF